MGVAFNWNFNRWKLKIKCEKKDKKDSKKDIGRIIPLPHSCQLVCIHNNNVCKDIRDGKYAIWGGKYYMKWNDLTQWLKSKTAVQRVSCYVALERIIIRTEGKRIGKYDTCFYEMYNSMRKNKFV